MRYFVPVLLLAGFAAGTLNANAQTKRLFIIGSSTSADFGATGYDSGYVGRLDKYYNQVAPQDTIVGRAAVPGYSVLKGMPTSHVPAESAPEYQPDPNANITFALSTLPGQGNADVVLVNYPTNLYDVLPISRIMASYRTIRDSAAAKGKTCFITTTQPRNTFSDANREKLREIKDSILAAFGYFAIDFWTGIADAQNRILPIYNADDIHLNNAGHRELFNRVVAKNVFNAALPASFISFEAIVQSKQNLVKWSTSSELNVQSFTIQRSDDGINFNRLADILPRSNAGRRDYQFTDIQPLTGWNYYRINSVDADGSKKFTPVFKVFVNSGKLSVRKVQNQPSQLLVELESGAVQQAELRVITSSGAVLYKQSRQLSVGTVNLPVPTGSYAHGIYYLHIRLPREQPLIVPFMKD